MFSEEIFFQAYIEELEKVSSEEARAVNDAALMESKLVAAKSRSPQPDTAKHVLGTGLALGGVGAVLGAMMSKKRKRLKGALIGGGLGGALGAATGYAGATNEQESINAARNLMRLPKAEQQAIMRDLARRRAGLSAHANNMELIEALGDAGSRVVHGY